MQSDNKGRGLSNDLAAQIGHCSGRLTADRLALHLVAAERNEAVATTSSTTETNNNGVALKAAPFTSSRA
jgi:hypothetical protein